MSILEVAFLSLIQGFSEFLPISSSGHLFVIHKFLNIEEGSLAFDVALHIGTILSIMCFFYKDFISVLKDTKNIVTNKPQEANLIYPIIVATIPAVIFGSVILSLSLDTIIRAIPVVSFNLIFFGILLYVADKNSSSEVVMKEVGIKRSFLIGCAQALALIPGVSRSGVCITMSRFLKIQKIDAIKFSMFISIPAILGAGILSFYSSISNNIPINMSDFIVGIVLSFIFGLVFIKLLLEFIKKFSFKVFMIYRICLGLILMAIYLLI